MSKITNIILGVFLLYNVNTNGQQIIADTVSSELSPGQSMEVYSRKGVTIAPGFYAPEGSAVSVGEIDSLIINTENLSGDLIYNADGGGIDNQVTYYSGTVAGFTPVLEDATEQIKLTFNNTTQSNPMDIVFTLDTNYQISAVGYMEGENFRNLSTEYYEIVFPNRLFIYNSKPAVKDNINVTGMDGLLKRPGEAIVISGLNRFPSWTIDIFAASDRSTPIRTLLNTSSWDGNDSFGDPVPPGVYIFTINVDNYGEPKKLSIQMIIQ